MLRRAVCCPEHEDGRKHERTERCSHFLQDEGGEAICGTHMGLRCRVGVLAGSGLENRMNELSTAEQRWCVFHDFRQLFYLFLKLGTSLDGAISVVT